MVRVSHDNMEHICFLNNFMVEITKFPHLNMFMGSTIIYQIMLGRKNGEGARIEFATRGQLEELAAAIKQILEKNEEEIER